MRTYIFQLLVKEAADLPTKEATEPKDYLTEATKKAVMALSLACTDGETRERERKGERARERERGTARDRQKQRKREREKEGERRARETDRKKETERNRDMYSRKNIDKQRYMLRNRDVCLERERGGRQGARNEDLVCKGLLDFFGLLGVRREIERGRRHIGRQVERSIKEQ